MISVNCINCGKTFEAERKSAKFCSVNCRVKWNNIKELLPLSFQYLKSEYDGQIIRMKAIGISVESQTFEQAVNAVIFLAGEAIGENATLKGELTALKKHQLTVDNTPKNSYFEPVITKEVTLFGEYSEELKKALSWTEIDATMKAVMLDGKLSRMEKDLLKEEARKARESNYC